MNTVGSVAQIGGTVVPAEMLSTDQLSEPPRGYDRWCHGGRTVDLIGGVCPGRCTDGGDHVHASNLAGTNVSVITLDELARWELVHRVAWDEVDR